LFIQVGDVGVVRYIRAFSKNDGHLKTDTLQIVKSQATIGKSFQLLFTQQRSRLAEFFSESSKLDSDSATSARVPLPTFRHSTLPSDVRVTETTPGY
jgi:hypothetical protein